MLGTMIEKACFLRESFSPPFRYILAFGFCFPLLLVFPLPEGDPSFLPFTVSRVSRFSFSPRDRKEKKIRNQKEGIHEKTKGIQMTHLIPLALAVFLLLIALFIGMHLSLKG